MTPWKKTFASSFIAQILSILGFSFALPFLPFFIAELGAYDAGEQAYWSGITLAAAGFTLAIFAPIWGVLADRYGRKLMVVRAMFGGTIVLILMSFVRTVPQLIACRLIQGAFTGTVAASVALVASVVPQRRSGLTLGMMQAAVFIGSSIGPFFGGVIADAFGYRTGFRMGALLVLIGGLFVYFGTHENFIGSGSRIQGSNIGFKRIFFIEGFLTAVVVMFAVHFSNTLINPSFPIIVQEILPNTENLNSITGSVIAAAALAGAFSSAFLGFTGDSIGHRKILIACCIGACAASAGHYYADTLNVLFFWRMLFGFSVAGMLPAANSMIKEIIDHKSIGKAFGLANSISMAGLALGPLAGGYIAKTAGLRTPFAFAAISQFLLGLLIVFLIKPEIKPGKSI
jgi:MFS transporter, DHA1 family, multidrug resistance protein